MDQNLFLSSTLDLFYFFGFIILLIAYCFLIFKPDFLAKGLLFLVSSFLPANKYPAIPFWNLLDQLKSRRRGIIVFLSITLLFLIFFNGYLFIQAFSGIIFDPDEIINLLIVLGIFIYAGFSTKEFFRIGSVDMLEISHPKEKKVQNIAENLSIAAGIQKPDIKIVTSTNPTAFSVAKFHEYPIIYLTTQLLHISTDNELEGVIGHEIAHIISKRTQDFTIINYLTVGLRTCFYILFVLLMFLFNPFIAAIWILSIAVYSFGSLKSTEAEEGEESKKIMANLFLALNPPYVLVNFLLVTLFYLFTGDEDFYADITSVQLNRYTGGIFSSLQKLRDYGEPKQSLPEDFSQLYFTKEAASRDSVTIQPDISTRLKILSSIDSLVAQVEVKAQTKLICPYCKSNLDELFVPTTYISPVKIDRCPVCHSVWFDQSELWIIADLTTLKPQKANSTPILGETVLLCPKCGVELFPNKSPRIPEFYKAFECPVCRGNFMLGNDVAGFGEYRKKFLEEHNKRED